MNGNDLLCQVKELLADAYNSTGRREQALDASELRDDDALFDFDGSGRPSLEFDSLDALEVAARLEDRFQISLPEEIDLSDLGTPVRIAAMLVRAGVNATEVIP
jgi:acyl carrier protein